MSVWIVRKLCVNKSRQVLDSEKRFQTMMRHASNLKMAYCEIISCVCSDLWAPCNVMLDPSFIDQLSNFAGEIDRCLKKVNEGVETFDDIWTKVRLLLALIALGSSKVSKVLQISCVFLIGMHTPVMIIYWLLLLLIIFMIICLMLKHEVWKSPALQQYTPVQSFPIITWLAVPWFAL